MSGSASLLFSYPKQAHFGRVIPKRKLYEQAEANTALKELFVQQVEQVVWAYKLAPETINVPVATTVSEIQIFQIDLKGSKLDTRVLQAIDKAIPFPLIFELNFNGKVRLAAAFKRPNEADAERWVVGSYFESDWQPGNSLRAPLPVALDLAALYEQLLTPLIDASGRAADSSPKATEVQEQQATYSSVAEPKSLSLEQRIELAETITAQQKEIERISSRLGREKQFNKRVAINAELRDAKQKLQRLKILQAASVMT